MFVKILPVDIAMGHAFFRAAIAEAVSCDRFISERMFLGLDRDVDYVANLLFHSSLLGFENPFSVWGGGVLRNSDLEAIFRRIMTNDFAEESAQDLADKLLLRLGMFPERIWGANVLSFKNYGRALYSLASQANKPPLHDQLESMADNFLPWTEVINAMKKRESLLIR
jgi:hypothetical protein